MKTKRSAQIFFTLLFVLCLIFSFIPDLHNTIHYGGVDLRTRVVGARVALEGKDPYFFQWRSGMPERLIDPDVQRNAKTSKLTVTPSVLTFHAPFVHYSYFQQKIIWLFLQWIALIVSLIVFLYKSKSLIQSILCSILSLFFANSLFWRLHLERSQIYIFIVFFLSIAFLIFQDKSHLRQGLSGLVLGIATALRPPLLLILLPFVIGRYWAVVTGSVVGILLGIWPLSDTKLWKSYFAALSNATRYLSSHGIPSAELNKIRIGGIYPEWIEGLNNITKAKDIKATNSSLQVILSNFHLGNYHSFPLVIGVIFLVLMLLYFNKTISKATPVNVLFLGGSVLYLFSEFFLPAPRYSYNDVQWLFPLFLIILAVKDIRFFGQITTGILITSLLFCIGSFPWIPKFLPISIYLMAFYVGKMTLELLTPGTLQTKSDASPS
jgi:Glycosyltransferase family 87